MTKTLRYKKLSGFDDKTDFSALMLLQFSQKRKLLQPNDHDFVCRSALDYLKYKINECTGHC